MVRDTVSRRAETGIFPRCLELLAAPLAHEQINETPVNYTVHVTDHVELIRYSQGRSTAENG